MNWTPAEQIARAVLYEGYLLYPYRRSALKNQWRWTFGVVPPAGSTGLDSLLETTPSSRLSVKVKFLREASGEVEEHETLLENIDPAGASHREVGFGVVDVLGEPAGADLVRLALRIENRADSCPLLSCHALLGVENGAFVSSTDPPRDARTAVCGRSSRDWLQRGTCSWRRRSSCRTIRPWRRKARATCSTAPRSTRC
jgi:hypothetical protein